MIKLYNTMQFPMRHAHRKPYVLRRAEVRALKYAIIG